MNKGDIQKLMKLGKCKNVFEEPFEADDVTGSGCSPILLHNGNEIQKRYIVVINQSKVTNDHELLVYAVNNYSINNTVWALLI